MATAVLMMAYGGPSSLDDIQSYLQDVMGGRPPAAATVAEVRQRYARIGGRSPLLDITRAQAAALQDSLNHGHGDYAGDPDYRVYVGMRHWPPYIAEAIGRIVAGGIHRVVALCMAPQYSRLSVGAYFARLDEAQAAQKSDLNVLRVDSWHNHPLLIEAIAQNVIAAGRRFPTGSREMQVLFTGHSLPLAATDGDPYAAQLAETARLVATKAGLRDGAWRLCYQSAGKRPGAWLAPDVEDVIVDVAGAGCKNVLVAPIGFVADHVETLYDIDIGCRAVAEKHGARLERSAALNTNPLLIAALTDIVRKATES